MQKYYDNVTFSNGGVLAPMSGATITIANTSGGSSQMYSGNGTGAIASTTTDAYGYFQFYAADGRYTITITKTGYSTTTRTDVLLEDPADGSAALSASSGASLIGYGASTVSAALDIKPSYDTDVNNNILGLDTVSGATILLNKSRSNILSRCLTGSNILQPGFSGYTHHIQTQLAAKPIAIRIGFPSLDTSASGATTINAIFGFDSTMGAVNSSASKGGAVATYNNITFGGSNTGTFSSNGAANAPTWLWSDWVQAPGSLDPTDGTIYPIIHLRIVETNASSNQTWFNGAYAASVTTEAASLGGSGTVNRTWRGYRSNAATDYVTANTSLFPANSGSAVAGFKACVIQYVCMETGVTLFTCGDSIYADMAATGVLTAPTWGHTCRTAETLHSLNIPIEVCNLGWSGQNPSQYLTRFQSLASQIGKAILFYGAWSPNNGTPTQSIINNQRAALGIAFQLANQYGMTIVIQSGTPSNATAAVGGQGGVSATTWGNADAYRTAYNAMLISTKNYTLDISTILSNPTQTVETGANAGQLQYEFNPTYSTDGLHPNEAGQIAWASALSTYLKSII